ncbi:MAG TPA: molecular chaperone TorD family protein [Candidatus Limnocylindrales bacterium]|nr:molecular chaperone TorD family protein [Candidatus Limnocylindrales bacterium]
MKQALSQSPLLTSRPAGLTKGMEAEAGKELGWLAARRSLVYNLLTSGFYPPTYELVEGIQEGYFMSSLKENLFPPLRYSPGMLTLESFTLEARERTRSAIYMELQAEYTRLFVGPGPPLVPPYESIYREAGYMVMGETTLSVLKAYEEAGRVLSSDLKDLPDHVAVELEFLALLCEEEAALWQREETLIAGVIQVEQSFLARHLLQWVPTFTKKVSETSSSFFYRGLAQVTVGYLLCENDYLHTLIDLLEAST